MLLAIVKKRQKMSTQAEVHPDTPKPRTWATHFCGCDMRTAVITVNLVTIGMLLFSVLFTLVLVVLLKKMESMSFDDDTLYDDEMKESMKELYGDLSTKYNDSLPVLMPILLTIAAIRTIFASAGIYGAVKYSVGPVVVGLVGNVLAFLFHAFTVNPFGAILAAFFAYPHYFFMRELNDMQSGAGDDSKYERQTDDVPMANGAVV